MGIPIRLILLLQGKAVEAQIGYHTAFTNACTDGRLESYFPIPYRSARTIADWRQIWNSVEEHVTNHGTNVVYLQYFHGRHIPDPRPFLDRLRSLPNPPVVVTSCGDGFDVFRNKPPASLLQAASRSDLVLSSSMGALGQLFKRSGAGRVTLMPHSACDVRFGSASLATAPLEHDLAFIGSKNYGLNFTRGHYWYGRKRASYVSALTKRYGRRFALYGNGWKGNPSWMGPVHFADQARACSSARIIFGGIPGSRQNYYTSDRPFIQMLSGRPLVDFHVPGVEAFFAPEEEWILFTNKSELFRKVDGLIEDSDRATEVGENGARSVRNRHMSSHRVDLIITMLEELLGARRELRSAHCPPLDYLIPGTQNGGQFSIGW